MLKLNVLPRASADAEEALTYYAAVSPALRQAFRDNLGAALHLLCEMPGIGSHRLAHLLPGAALQVWSLDRFPFMVCYRATGDRLHVVRIVHERRNVTRALLRAVK
jgi:toxin ParE1/3/4